MHGIKDSTAELKKMLDEGAMGYPRRKADGGSLKSAVDGVHGSNPAGKAERIVSASRAKGGETLGQMMVEKRTRGQRRGDMLDRMSKNKSLKPEQREYFEDEGKRHAEQMEKDKESGREGRADGGSAAKSNPKDDYKAQSSARRAASRDLKLVKMGATRRKSGGKLKRNSGGFVPFGSTVNKVVGDLDKKMNKPTGNGPTTVNIHVGGKGDQQPGAPAPAPMAAPHPVPPPMPVVPPPPGQPVSMAGPGAPPGPSPTLPGMPPMMRKRGGGILKKSYRTPKDMDAGALGGKGRLEKIEIQKK